MALTGDRKTDQYGDKSSPDLEAFGVAASTKIYGGAIVAVNSSGYALGATAAATNKVRGIALRQVDNSSGSNGALTVTVVRGWFLLDNGTGVDAITNANIDALCYASDDHTVNLTDSSGTRPAVGVIGGVAANGQIIVAVGVPSLSALNPEASSGGSASRQAKGVVYNNQAALATFTVASDDGITYAAGDIVLLAGQTTAAQNGPYVVGTVATGTAPLTRPDWWATGAAVPNGFVIDVAAGGTFYAGSSWKAMCTGAKVIGTDDPLFYPRVYQQTVTLASGTYTIGFGSTATPDEPLFLFSTTKSMVQMAHNTTGGTIGTAKYAAPVASRVAGKNGTAVVVVNSLVDAGTVQSADTSTVDVLITNW